MIALGDRGHRNRYPILISNASTPQADSPPMNPYDAPKSKTEVQDAATISTSAIRCECGSTNLTRVKPKELVAFAKDYQCVQCRRQFPAPVPVWAALLFMILGFPFACLGVLWIVANLASANPIALAIGAGILFMGATSFWKGITSFRKKA